MLKTVFVELYHHAIVVVGDSIITTITSVLNVIYLSLEDMNSHLYELQDFEQTKTMNQSYS